MKHKDKRKTGDEPSIVLDELKLNVAKLKTSNIFIFYYCIILLGVLGSFGFIYITFPIYLFPIVTILSTLIICAVFTYLFTAKEHHNITFIVSLFLLFIIAGIFNRIFTNGILHTMKCILGTYYQSGASFRILIPAPVISDQEVMISCTFVAIWLMAVLSLLMSWLLISRRSIAIASFTTAPFLFAPLIFTITPNIISVGMILLFFIFLLFASPSISVYKKFTKNRKGFAISSVASAHPISFTIMPIFLVLCLLLSVIFPAGAYSRPQIFSDIRQLIDRGVNSTNISSMLRAATGGDLDTSDLSSSGNISFKNEPVLSVTYSNMRLVGARNYLYGFIGSTYTGSSWDELEPDAKKRIDKFFKPVDYNAQNFKNLVYYNFEKALEEGPKNYTITVSNNGADPRRIYAPYGLANDKRRLQDMEFADESYLISTNKTFGTSNYSLNAVALSGEDLYMSLNDRVLKYLNEEYPFLNASDYDSNGDPLYYQNFLDDSQVATVQTFELYNNIVDKYYLQLPEDTEAVFKKYLKDRNLSLSNYDNRYSFAFDVIKAVQKENEYTLSPGTMPEGEDFATYFLLENHKGYCKHFATATVALLRAGGVPARYVEGFTVSKDDFAAHSSTAEVLDSAAHAWVEIYVDGTGWVPIEATPAAAFPTQTPRSQNPTQSHQPSSPNSSSNKEPSSSSKPAESSSAKHSSKDSNAQGENSPILPIAITVGVLLLTAAAFAVNRAVRVSIRKKRCKDSDKNKAAIELYLYASRLLEFLNSQLKTDKEIDDELLSIAQKAKFSSHTITDEELKIMRDGVQQYERKIKTSLPFIKILKCKYIDILL